MSMELRTNLFGVNRPPSENLEGRGKRMKLEPGSDSASESDSESEPGSKPKRRVIYDWELKRPEDLVASDFSMYEDDPKPFAMVSGRFEYKNKAWIEREKQIKIAMADYTERSRNLSLFDAIAPPEIANICGGVIPLTIDDELRDDLIPLCNAALESYNTDKGSNFMLADIIRTTWRAGRMYYITFQAQDHSNSNVTTFQAQVRLMLVGPHKVYSCAIKT